MVTHEAVHLTSHTQVVAEEALGKGRGVGLFGASVANYIERSRLAVFCNDAIEPTACILLVSVCSHAHETP